VVKGEATLKQYLLAVYQPDGPVPPPEVLDKIARDLEAYHDRLKAAGAWVFSGGLHPPSKATVLRPQGHEVLVTDGPYAEAKEHIGGFTIIRARRPRRRPGVGPAGGHRHDAADRGPAVPGRSGWIAARSSASSGGSTAGPSRP
jgi:hypothetical protein